MENSKKIVIVAPHADDEIIGCYEVLTTGLVRYVCFLEEGAEKEAVVSRQLFGYDFMDWSFIQKGQNLQEYLIMMPDPYFELHPLHKVVGGVGLFLQTLGIEIVFYSTNMNAPYIRTVRLPGKRANLNACYGGSEKAELWRFDHKYFLFEGQVKHIQGWERG